MSLILKRLMNYDHVVGYFPMATFEENGLAVPNKWSSWMDFLKSIIGHYLWLSDTLGFFFSSRGS